MDQRTPAWGSISRHFDDGLRGQTLSLKQRLKYFIFLDIESYYDRETCTLKKLTTPEYIFHPKFQVHMLAAYDIRWPAPKIILPHEISAFLAQYPADETAGIAHNMLFDGPVLAWKYNWVPGLLLDTLGMVRALRNYRRNSLGEVIKKLFGRDTKGDVIHKLAGMDVQAIKQAGLWPTYCEYAMNDVRECFFIAQKLLPEFPEEEALIMDLVLRAAIEPRLQADVPMLETHLEDLRRRKATLLREAGYDKATLMSQQMFRDALEALGVEIEYKISPTNRQIPAFAKTDEFMSELLEYSGSRDDDVNFAVQTLAAARLSHKSTIEETRAQRFVNIAKLPWRYAFSEVPWCHPEDPEPCLLPVPLRYGGAHTHRLSGEWKMNMQNLPRDKVRSKLRAALTAPPGHKLITGDLAQIEARIVAKLAGQSALVEAFRRGDDVYAQFAGVVFGRSVNKKDQPNERFIGKTAILGLGYGCGAARFYSMVVTQARQFGIPLEGLFDERIAEATVRTYRSLFNFIPRAWQNLDLMLASVINSHNLDQKRKWPDVDTGPMTIRSGCIELPNKMTLRYTMNDKKLYGAKIFENIVQALARNVIMESAVRLAQRGYRFALQSHDELLFVVPEDDVDEAKRIITEEMIREPRWMPGLPLAVEVGIGDNYGSCK